MPQKKRSRRDEFLAALFADNPMDSGAVVDKGDSRDSDAADPEDLTEQGLMAKEVALSISKSIVSLLSFVDGRFLFACSGTVVHHVGSGRWILTSATLVRKPDSDYEAYEGGDIKIEVLLHNKRTIQGCLAMCNLHYNVAVVTIESHLDLPMVELHDLPGSYSMVTRPVIAVGRDFQSTTLLVTHGELIRESSELDCAELLVCTCPVSKIFIGGLVMDFERKIVGVTFFGMGNIPFLPIEIVARCLEYIEDFRKFGQPYLCIKVQALHRLELRNLEKICSTYPDLYSGIVVEKISDELLENCGGIEVGDIICTIDGIVLDSAAQLTAIFLDKVVVAMRTKNTMIVQLNILEIASGVYDPAGGFVHRWTLPSKKQNFGDQQFYDDRAHGR